MKLQKDENEKMETDEINQNDDGKENQSEYPFRRIVSKIDSQPYRYIRVKIEEHIYGRNSSLITASQSKHAINMSMKALFGELGSVTTIDILSFDLKEKLAIIRCPSKFYVKLRSAVTFVTQIGDTPVTLHVTQSSAHLMGLSCNSRDYVSSTTTS